MINNPWQQKNPWHFENNSNARNLIMTNAAAVTKHSSYQKVNFLFRMEFTSTTVNPLGLILAILMLLLLMSPVFNQILSTKSRLVYSHWRYKKTIFHQKAVFIRIIKILFPPAPLGLLIQLQFSIREFMYTRQWTDKKFALASFREENFK